MLSLLQDGKPIAYASRALTYTETNYAQIEKELLSIVFWVERFHQYTYGRKVVVDSDHKPLDETCKDEVLQAVKAAIQCGWPERKSNLPAAVTAYFPFRNELVVQDGRVLRGDRVVIPRIG